MRPRLVAVPQDKLTRLEWPLLWIAPGKTAPLDRRLADAIPIAEVFPFGGQLTTILAVDRRHAWQLLVGLACLLQDLLEARSVGRERGDRQMRI